MCSFVYLLLYESVVCRLTMYAANVTRRQIMLNAIIATITA